MGFKYLFLQESWQEELLNSKVNIKFYVCMDAVIYYFDVRFPLESFYVTEPKRNTLHKD